VVLLSMAPTLAAGDPRVIQGRVVGADAASTLEIRWPAGAGCTVDIRNREALLRCVGPVEWREEASEGAAAPWYEPVRVGYDTVLVRAARPGVVRVEHAASAMRLVYSAEETPGTAAAAEDASGAVRLDLLRVQWLTFVGRYAEAGRVLDRLAARAPSHPDVLVARGRFEAERGRPAQADAFYDEARRLAPEREDIVRLIDSIEARRAWRASVESEIRTVSGGWDERMFRLGLQGTAGPYQPVTFTAERLQSTAVGVRRADGVVRPLEADLRRFELSGAAPLGSGATARGTLFGTPGGLGAGGSATWHGVRGASTITAEFGRPFWEFLESVADDGRRDRLGVQRQWRLGASTAAWALLDWNRYRLASGASTSTVAFTAGAVRTIRRGRPTLTLQYGIDKEQRLSSTVVRADDGLEFTPVPLVSREVHLLGMIAALETIPLGRIEATGGYTFDRFGGRGGFLTARMTPRDTARAGLDLWIDRRLYMLATTQQVLRVGARFAYRF
jgi:hypothetical protein